MKSLGAALWEQGLAGRSQLSLFRRQDAALEVFVNSPISVYRLLNDNGMSSSTGAEGAVQDMWHVARASKLFLALAFDAATFLIAPAQPTILRGAKTKEHVSHQRESNPHCPETWSLYK